MSFGIKLLMLIWKFNTVFNVVISDFNNFKFVILANRDQYSFISV